MGHGTPIDADNRALVALRYLVSRLDARFIGRLRKRAYVAEPNREAAIRKVAEERWNEARRGVFSSFVLDGGGLWSGV